MGTDRMTERLNIVNIKELVSQLSSEYRIPSAAIRIFHDGTITDFAVGLMTLSTREPATAYTIY